MAKVTIVIEDRDDGTHMTFDMDPPISPNMKSKIGRAQQMGLFITSIITQGDTDAASMGQAFTKMFGAP